MCSSTPHTCFPLAYRLGASMPELDEVVPAPAGAEPVDDPEQLVGVRRLDCFDGPWGDHGLGPVETGRSRLDQSENDPM